MAAATTSLLKVGTANLTLDCVSVALEFLASRRSDAARATSAMTGLFWKYLRPSILFSKAKLN